MVRVKEEKALASVVVTFWERKGLKETGATWAERVGRGRERGKNDLWDSLEEIQGEFESEEVSLYLDNEFFRKSFWCSTYS